MGRSVVRAGAVRCPRCSLPPRWCVCDMLPPVVTRLGVHVLIHRHEYYKPSSTGKMVARAVAGATCHVYQRATRFHPPAGVSRESLAPEGELWILHPGGGPLPQPDTTDCLPPPAILLLDATWRQAGEMLRGCAGLGRCVRLSDAEAKPSRYWLRGQPCPTHLSTAEALMAVLTAMGEVRAGRELRLHFEMHVYATLLARGRRDLAERFRRDSPLETEAPDALHHLHERSEL